jgi:chromosome segregation ATPase
MTLQDLLRQHTREAQDALEGIEDKIRQLGSQKRAELSQMEKLQAEIDTKHSSEKLKNQRLEENETKIRELERQIEELNQEKKILIEALKDAEIEVEDASRQKKKVETRATNYDHEINVNVAEKEHLTKRLKTSRHVAFHAYLEEIEKRLAKAVSAQEEIAGKLASRRKLEEARHENNEVMNLYEAKLEIDKLLKMSTVTAVREQLNQQLRAIEGKIEALYPGALAVDDQTQVISQIEELFFATWREGKTNIYIPITLNAWKEIAKGECSIDKTSTLRLLWGLARGLGIDHTNSRLKVMDDVVLLEVDKDFNISSESHSISMPLPGSGSIAFLLSKLPREVQEAIKHEDTAN